MPDRRFQEVIAVLLRTGRMGCHDVGEDGKRAPGRRRPQRPATAPLFSAEIVPEFAQAFRAASLRLARLGAWTVRVSVAVIAMPLTPVPDACGLMSP